MSSSCTHHKNVFTWPISGHKTTLLFSLTIFFFYVIVVLLYVCHQSSSSTRRLFGADPLISIFDLASFKYVCKMARDPWLLIDQS